MILFLLSTVFSLFFFVAGALGLLGFVPVWEAPKPWIENSLLAFLTEAIVFWVGIIEVYASSLRLGIRWRVIGAVVYYGQHQSAASVSNSGREIADRILQLVSTLKQKGL